MPVFDRRTDINTEDIVGWRIWYPLGVKKGSREGDQVDSVKGDEIQVVKIFHRRRNRPLKMYATVFAGRDRYKLPGTDRVLTGSLIGDDGYNAIYQSAFREEF
jgi:hypothetical protein